MHPVGPYSPRVYWARRISVLVVLVLVLVGLIFVIANRGGGTGGAQAAGVNSSLPSTSTPSLTGVLASTTSVSSAAPASSPAAEPAGSAPSGSATSPSAKPSATRTLSAAEKSAAAKAAAEKAAKDKAAAEKAAADKAAADKAAAEKAAADKAAAEKAAAEKAAADKAAAEKAAAEKAAAEAAAKARKPTKDAAGNLICGDGAMELQATTGAPSFTSSSQPVLGVKVTYTGDERCRRDLSGPLQVFTVFGVNGDRVWSTADCFPGTGQDIRTLNPSDSLQYNIRWSGTTSSPGCGADRIRVPAGNYVLQVSIGNLKAKPTPFTITEG